MEEILFRRTELEDQQLISQYFRNYPSRSCERTFSNVYLWSRHYHVTFAIVEGALVFRSESNGQYAYAYPAGEEEQVHRAIDVLMDDCKAKGQEFTMYGVTEENFAQFDSWYPGQYDITYRRNEADYVYEAEKLATLSGKKLHGKRNHIHKFKSLYPNWTYEEMSEDNVEDCFQMALLWRKENGCEEDEDKRAEICVTLNSLRLFRELGLRGGVLRVDGEVVAFTIGEPVCDDTFVVHVEKAFSSIQGAYPMINQQFVEHACTQYTYVNREEDMGAEGLRKAKLSYRPAFLVGKGVVTKKSGGL